MEIKQKHFGRMLVEKGLISEEQLKKALEEQETTKEFLGAILLKKYYIAEDELLNALSEEFNLPVVRLRHKYIDWNIVQRFSPSLILDYKCVPIDSSRLSVTVVVTNPLDMWTLKKIEEEAGGRRVKLALTSEGDLKDVIARYKVYMKGKYFK